MYSLLKCTNMPSNCVTWYVVVFFSYRAQYSKRTKQWRPVTLLQPKQYKYIPELIAAIYEEQLKKGSVNTTIQRSAQDPRNIDENIAIVPRPMFSAETHIAILIALIII